jgi:ankyrin repeat protein
LQEQYYHFYALENNLKNTDEAYPLHSAIINGEIERASSLLEQVTDINALDAFQMTPLMLACRSGANTIALKLIEMNAHLDCICPSTGKTAIFWAVEHHQIDVMKALVDKGANLSIIEKSGKTLNMLAAMNDNVVFLRYFNDPNTINHQDNHRRTALHYACLYKCSHYISSLLDIGANPTLCDHHGNNLLHFFDQIKHSDKYGLIPRLMNDFGLNCNAQNKSLESAWMRAMEYPGTGNFEQFTKNNSVDFCLRDAMGNSFSHYCASPANQRNRERLKQHFHLHDLNDQGQTPAYFAFINYKFETFERITSEVVSNGGWHYVKDKQNKSLLHWAAQLGALHYMEHFLQMNGVDINERDDDGNTAVYFAIKHKQVACLDYLIYHRANVKISDLELALKLGNDQLISLLEPYRNHLIQNIQNTRGSFFDSFKSAASTKAATNSPK